MIVTIPELFQTLKFSTEILEEMNNKRRSIVGGGAAESKKDQFDNLEQVRTNVKMGMVNIGGALPPANSTTRYTTQHPGHIYYRRS